MLQHTLYNSLGTLTVVIYLLLILFDVLGNLFCRLPITDCQLLR
jgi:hypothetical protein